MCEPSKMVLTVTVNGLRHARQFQTPSRSWVLESALDSIRFASAMTPQCGQAGPFGPRIRSSIARASASLKPARAVRLISEEFMDPIVGGLACYVKCIIPPAGPLYGATPHL